MMEELEPHLKAFNSAVRIVAQICKRIHAFRGLNERVSDLEISLMSVQLMLGKCNVAASTPFAADAQHVFGICEEAVQNTSEFLDEFQGAQAKKSSLNRFLRNLKKLFDAESIQARIQQLKADLHSCLPLLNMYISSETHKIAQQINKSLNAFKEELQAKDEEERDGIKHEIEAITSAIGTKLEGADRENGMDELEKSIRHSMERTEELHIASRTTASGGISEGSGATSIFVEGIEIPGGVYVLSHREFSVDTEKFLGEGSFGHVHPGVWRGTEECAVKVISDGVDDAAIRDFLNEALTLVRLNSFSSFVKLYGICIYRQELMLVMKRMKQNLYEYLKEFRQRGETPAIAQALDWSLSIASGMRTLHQQYRTCHRDLKSPNIFLTSNMKLRIGDFGQAITRRPGMSVETVSNTAGASFFVVEGSGGVVGTYRWMAPEVLTGDAYTTASDVFSFGVIMWELLSAGLPWEGIGNEMKLAMALGSGKRLPLPDAIPKPLSDFIKRMWSAVPSDRPSFKEVCTTLEDIRSSIRPDPGLSLSADLPVVPISAVTFAEKEPVVARANVELHHVTFRGASCTAVRLLKGCSDEIVDNFLERIRIQNEMVNSIPTLFALSPHGVAVFDGTVPVYIVRRYPETLDSFLGGNSRITTKKALKWTMLIAEGIHALHESHDTAHAQLTLGNIYIARGKPIIGCIDLERKNPSKSDDIRGLGEILSVLFSHSHSDSSADRQVLSAEMNELLDAMLHSHSPPPIEAVLDELERERERVVHREKDEKSVRAGEHEEHVSNVKEKQDDGVGGERPEGSNSENEEVLANGVADVSVLSPPEDRIESREAEGALASNEPLTRPGGLSDKVWHRVEKVWRDKEVLLDVSNCYLRAGGARALSEPLSRLTFLQVLDLSDNSLRAGRAQALAEALVSLTSLKTLALSQNSLGPEGALALADPLSRLTSLQTLYLDHNSLGMEGAGVLAEPLSRLTSLQTLYLHDNSLGAEGARALMEPLSRIPSLQSLELSNNSLCAHGLQALAEPLGRLTSLLGLGLSENSLGIEGGKALAEPLTHLTSLRMLYLHNNSLTAEGAHALVEPLSHLTSLEQLSLYGNSLSAEGAQVLVEPLNRLTSLEVLWLSNNSIGFFSKRKLRKALKCKVIF